MSFHMGSKMYGTPGCIGLNKLLNDLGRKISYHRMLSFIERISYRLQLFLCHANMFFKVAHSAHPSWL